MVVFLRTDILFTIGGQNFHLPKLIGAFLVFGAILMLFQSVAHMFEVWDSLKDYPNCIKATNQSEDSLLEAQQMYSECKESLYRKTGLQLLFSQVEITMRQYWMTLLQPIAGIFFWAIVFFFGIMLYNTGKIIIPLEQSTKKKKKKKGK